MASLYIKIVGVEGESVLVKYSSENSAKATDDYPAAAYQPKMMGYKNLDDFIAGITPGLSTLVAARDAAEANETDISSWVDHTSVQEIVKEEPIVVVTPTSRTGDVAAEVLL